MSTFPSERESRRAFVADARIIQSHLANSFWYLLKPEELNKPFRKLGRRLYRAYEGYLLAKSRIEYQGRTETPLKVGYHSRFGWIVRGQSGMAFLGKISLAGRPSLQLGHGSYFSGCSTVLGSGHLRVGAWSCIGPNVTIATEDMNHPSDYLAHINFATNPRTKLLGLGDFNPAYGQVFGQPAEVRVGNDAWVGREAFIFAGAHVGNGSVLGARSVLTKELPRYEVWAGNPARYLRRRFAMSDAEAAELLSWWDWSPDEMIRRIDMFETRIGPGGPTGDV